MACKKHGGGKKAPGKKGGKKAAAHPKGKKGGAHPKHPMPKKGAFLGALLPAAAGLLGSLF